MKYRRFIAFAFIVVSAGNLFPSFAQKLPAPKDYGACLISNGKEVGNNRNKTFAMHSVMKFPQALYVADQLRKRSISLTDSTLVRKNELMRNTWSPMLQWFDDQKFFTYADLLALSLAQSDNNACDLLFNLLGNPSQVETYIHKLGFTHINIKHTEREMGSNPALSSENNCTPNEMARLFVWFYQHKDDDEYLAFVWNTMASCQTGTERLPAAIDQGTKIVHKTGTGFPYPDQTADRNDAGIILMPDGSCLAIAIFVPRCQKDQEVASAAKKVLNKAGNKRTGNANDRQ